MRSLSTSITALETDAAAINSTLALTGYPLKQEAQEAADRIQTVVIPALIDLGSTVPNQIEGMELQGMSFGCGTAGSLSYLLACFTAAITPNTNVSTFRTIFTIATKIVAKIQEETKGVLVCSINS